MWFFKTIREQEKIAELIINKNDSIKLRLNSIQNKKGDKNENCNYFRYTR